MKKRITKLLAAVLAVGLCTASVYAAGHGHGTGSGALCRGDADGDGVCDLCGLTAGSCACAGLNAGASHHGSRTGGCHGGRWR